MSLPAIIMIVYWCLALGIWLAKNGEVKIEKYSFKAALITVAIQFGILYWGGFFN